MKPSEAVHEFHTKFGIPKAHPNDEQSMGFRMRLISEEYREVIEAAGFQIEPEPEEIIPAFPSTNCNPAHLLKELADLAYVIYGTAEAFGWDLDEAVRRIHESNMSKLGADGKPIHREDGKVLKGPNYKEPYLGDLV